jgi:hypothetical protein
MVLAQNQMNPKRKPGGPICEECGSDGPGFMARAGDTLRRLCVRCAGLQCGFIESPQQKLERELEKKNAPRGVLHPERA